MNHSAEPFAEWRSVIAELLAVDTNLLDLQPLGGRSQVWAVKMRGQIIALAKRHPPQAAESHSPAWLASRIAHYVSPPAVRCLGVSESHHLLLTEWIEGQTLDAALQAKDRVPPAFTHAFLDGYLALEARFASAREALIPLAYPMDYPRYLRDSLDSALLLAGEVFHLPSHLLDALESVISALPPTVGPLDCNAQNLLFDGERFWFIDLARIGWDWSERRLVQYAFALGGRGGLPKLLLDPVSVSNYAMRSAEARGLSASAVERGVDAHAFLAALLLIERLRMLMADPNEWPLLAALWDRPEERLAHAWQIACTPLSSDPDLGAARAHLGNSLKALA